MKRINKWIYVGLAGLLSLQTACNDDEYTPGESPTVGNPGVYIEDIDERLVVVTPEDEAYTLTLHREVADQALNVPIVVTRSGDGIQVPGQVHFEAGATQASLTLDIRRLTAGKTTTLGLRIPDTYTNLYRAFPNGASSMTINFYQGEWLPVGTEEHPVQWWWSTNTQWKVQGGTLYRLGDLQRYKVVNFLGSGKDLFFSLESVKKANGYTTCAVVPGSKNVFYSVTDTFTAWEFQNEDGYITVYPDANNPTDAYEQFSCYDKYLPDGSYYSVAHIYDVPQSDGNTVSGYLNVWMGDDYEKSTYDYLKFAW